MQHSAVNHFEWALRHLKTIPVLPCTAALLMLMVGCIQIASANSYLITNVNVIPMTSETVLANQNVMVTDNQITAIGNSSDWKMAEDETSPTEIIDADGGYLIPGLAEMHAHIPPARSGQNAIDRVLHLNLVNGVVLVRGMLGEAAHLELREQLKNGERIGPELVTSGPSLSGGSVRSQQQAITMVREQHAAGYDFIKLHPGLSRGQYQAATREGLRLGIPLSGHVSAEVGLEQSLLSHQATIDHLDGYAQALIPYGDDNLRREPGFFGVSIAGAMRFDAIDRIAVQTGRENVWNVPTETLMLNVLGELAVEQMQAWPEMHYVDPSIVDNWTASVRSIRKETTQNQRRRLLAMRQQLLFALHKADAGLLLGSDAPQIFNVPGFALHRELQAMVNAGLTPYQALRMGTSNVGEFFERDRWGTIQPGAPANLTLLAKNPLKNIGNTETIHGVMQAGKWYNRQQLTTLLAEYRTDQE